jgi:glyoxylate/hydroxypyruvate reductase A
MLVYVNTALDDEATRLLRARRPRVTYYVEANDPADGEHLARADVVFGALTAAQIDQASSLRWLQLDSVGLDGYVPAAGVFADRNILVTNLGHIGCEAVADSAVAAALAILRGVPTLAELHHRRQWRAESLRRQLRLLSQTRVLLLGYGAIGQLIERRLTGFGCTHIVRVARRPRPRDAVLGLDGLPRLSETDLLFMSVPATPQTQDLIGELEIRSMPRGSIVVNVGRASALRQSALQEALRDGHLDGAALDVTDQEPIPSDSDLWTTPRLLLTQHTGGGWEAESPAKVSFFLENLQRYQGGLPLAGVADLTVGY